MTKKPIIVVIVIGMFLFDIFSFLPLLPVSSHEAFIELASNPSPDSHALSITLILSEPEYAECGEVSINGYVGTTDGYTTHLSWNWDDGTVVNSWFPASHRYSSNGTFSVQVTAYSSTGETETETTTVTVDNAEDLGCSYTVRLHPMTIILRNEQITETLRIEIRDEDGSLISSIGHQVSFTSADPSLVQVDASGVITSTGFGETEIEALVEGIPRKATARVVAGHFRVEPPILLLSTTDEPTGTLALDVANANGTPVNLDNHSISFSGGKSVASVNDEGVVTALAPPQSFWESPYIDAQLDEHGANNAAFIRVTTSTLGLTLDPYIGEHTAIYVSDQVGPYPYGQLMEELQTIRVSDAAYLLERWLTGIYPSNGDLQFLVMDPGYDDDGTVPCGLSGNPVRLGVGVDNYRSCFGGEDWLQWGVMYHETGHNFMGQRAFHDLISGLPNSVTYNEGMASMLGIYAVDTLIEEPDQYGLTITTTENLSRDDIPLTPNWARAIIAEDLSAYEADPDYENDFNADILDAIMTKLHDEYGMTFFYRFLSAFMPPDEPLSTTLSSEGERLAFWVAACSAAAREDLQSRFRDEWGFPLDEAFYEQIYPEVQRLVAQRDPAADAGRDRAIPLGESVTLDDAYVFDWEGDPLTVTWQIISHPPESAVSLSDPKALHPSFLPDVPGRYILSIMASDGFITGTYDTVSILVGTSFLYLPLISK